MNYISLGPTCSVAYQLEKLNLKKESLPFDWIRCNSIFNVLNLIKNNFEGFFEDLTHVKDSSSKFPFISDDDQQFDNIKEMETKIYKSKHIGFFHDFKDGISIDDVKEKYNRRIKRFYEKIRNKSVFIRDDIHFKNENIPYYNELNKILKEYNNENQLVLIININRFADLSTLDKSIIVYFDDVKQTEWQHPAIQPFLLDISSLNKEKFSPS